MRDEWRWCFYRFIIIIVCQSKNMKKGGHARCLSIKFRFLWENGYILILVNKIFRSGLVPLYPNPNQISFDRESAWVKLVYSHGRWITPHTPQSIERKVKQTFWALIDAFVFTLQVVSAGCEQCWCWRSISIDTAKQCWQPAESPCMLIVTVWDASLAWVKMNYSAPRSRLKLCRSSQHT